MAKIKFYFKVISKFSSCICVDPKHTYWCKFGQIRFSGLEATDCIEKLLFKHDIFS